MRAPAFFLAFLWVFLLLSVPVFAAGGGGGHGNSKSQNPFAKKDAYFVQLDPMVLPIISERGINEIVSMIVTLEVPDERTVEKVNDSVPRLSDAYMRALYGHIDKSVYRNGHFLDVAKIKVKLVAVTDAMFGPGVVRDVLIQGVNQRRYN